MTKSVTNGLKTTVALGLFVAMMSATQAQSSLKTWGTIPSPQIPNDGSVYTALASSETSQFALKDDGTVIAGSSLHDLDFTNMPANLKAIAIGAGNFHGLAVRPDHTVVAWGRNNAGQSSVPAGLANVVAVAGGYYHSLALKADGTVVGWGNNIYGQSTAPSGLNRVVKIRAGGYNSYAIRDDGTVVSFGGIPAPSTLNHVVDIECGYDHTMALKSDGTVVIFGVANDYGQMTPPRTLTNVKMIASAKYTSFAMFNDGTCIGWGKNDLGQAIVPAFLFPPTLFSGGLNTIMAYIPDQAKVQFAKPTVYGGSTAIQTGTLSVLEPAASNRIFSLTTSSPGETSVPATVVVPAGATQVPFTVGHSLVATGKSVTITATNGASTGSASFNLLAPGILRFTTDAPTVEGGQTIHGSLTLAATFKAPLTVNLSANTSAMTLPPSVTVRAGVATAVFSIDLADVAIDTVGTLTASVGDGDKTAKVSIKAKPGIKSFTISPNALVGNSTATGTITLKAPAGESGQTVTLVAGAGLTVPTSVHFDPGQSVGMFDIVTADVTTITTTSVTASTTFSTYNRPLAVKPMQIASVTLSPASIHAGETTTFTVNLLRPVRTDTTVDVVVVSPGVATAAAATIVIPAGSQSGTVSVQGSAILRTQTTGIRAIYRGVAKGQTLTVNP